MSQTDPIKDRWHDVLAQTGQELEEVLNYLRTTEITTDYELIERVIVHHMHQCEESMTVLCKILEAHRQGALDTTIILSLAQWT